MGEEVQPIFADLRRLLWERVNWRSDDDGRACLGARLPTISMMAREFSCEMTGS